MLTLQVTKLEAHREALMSHMHKAEECCAQLVEQVKALKDKWCATCVENVKLYKKIFELRKALNPGRTLHPNSSIFSDTFQTCYFSFFGISLAINCDPCGKTLVHSNISMHCFWVEVCWSLPRRPQNLPSMIKATCAAGNGKLVVGKSHAGGVRWKRSVVRFVHWP